MTKSEGLEAQYKSGPGAVSGYCGNTVIKAAGGLDEMILRDQLARRALLCWNPDVVNELNGGLLEQIIAY